MIEVGCHYELKTLIVKIQPQIKWLSLELSYSDFVNVRIMTIVFVTYTFVQACVKRIQGDESGHKHCTGQYFDYWSCVDKCVSVCVPNLPTHTVRLLWFFSLIPFSFGSDTKLLIRRWHLNYLKSWSNCGAQFVMNIVAWFLFSVMSSWFCSMWLRYAFYGFLPEDCSFFPLYNNR